MMGHMGVYSGNWSDMPEGMQNMMQNYYGGMYQYGNWYGLGHLVICVLVIALLVALVRYVWKLGDKVK